MRIWCVLITFFAGSSRLNHFPNLISTAAFAPGKRGMMLTHPSVSVLSEFNKPATKLENMPQHALAISEASNGLSHFLQRVPDILLLTGDQLTTWPTQRFSCPTGSA